MIIACAWHPSRIGKVLFLGQKEPLQDNRVAHSICMECKFAMEIKTLLDQKREKADKDFIAFKGLAK